LARELSEEGGHGLGTPESDEELGSSVAHFGSDVSGAIDAFGVRPDKAVER
jgi:hypothetical protein